MLHYWKVRIGYLGDTCLKFLVAKVMNQSEKEWRKGPSTKYDHFMRVSMEENEENEKTIIH